MSLENAADLPTQLKSSRNWFNWEQQSSQAFPFQQFHVLFHSLFRVLFIFPSRYLFAIGLLLIFSLGWNLPPILDCIPKQSDSLTRPHNRHANECKRGFHPLWPKKNAEALPHSSGLYIHQHAMVDMFPVYNSLAWRKRFQTWTLPVSFAITKGILVSFFSSAY